MRILTVCPSIYPEKLQKMEDSFLITKSPETDIFINSGGTVTEAINYIFKQFPNYDFYFIANDDIEFLTPEWDIKLAKKGKISYGNDLLQGQNLCTFPMIDGDIVRALGWLQLPTLTKYSGDQAWMIIGKTSGILDYHGDVLIHHHWQGWDEELGKQDLERVNSWLKTDFFSDLEKVRKVINETE